MIGISSPQVFVQDPKEQRFICEVLAECAAVSRTYSFRQAYQVLRIIDAEELFELYKAWRQSNDVFRAAFGPIYNRERGELEAGELFAEDE